VSAPRIRRWRYIFWRAEDAWHASPWSRIVLFNTCLYLFILYESMAWGRGRDLGVDRYMIPLSQPREQQWSEHPTISISTGVIERYHR